jgi:hypothetical protein
MLKTSSNGIQATTAIKFSLRPTAETLADLSRPIAPGTPLPATFITVPLVGAGRFRAFRRLVVLL